MATKHYAKRVTKSQARASKALGLFQKAAEVLETEARNQREVYDLLDAERDAAYDAYSEAKTALTIAFEAQDSELVHLQEQAQEAGTRAQKQAEALRGLFI